MPFYIVRNDITKMDVDAIVNAAKQSLLGGGGVDGAIHKAAGPELLEECRKLHGCAVGEAKITKGYRLKARYIIHTVGPVYQDGMHGEKALLASCYRQSLDLADTYHCHSTAFPLISSGAYGYPKEEALQIATDTIQEFLENHEMTVYLVIFDAESVMISKTRFQKIQEYIDDTYVSRFENRRRELSSISNIYEEVTLEDALQNMDESFSQMLLRKIDEAGMKDSECYKRANIDRKLFSKIRSDVHYKPKKQTVLAFAIALHLSLDEMKEMLEKAGYALSHSNRADIIVEYYVMHHNYNIFEINAALFSFKQPLIGQ